MNGYARSLLLDWSAFTRVLLARANGPGGRRLLDDALERFDAALLADELLVCVPFRLEALYSTRSPAEYAQVAAELDGFRQAAADAQIWDVAQRAQRTLARAPGVSHRVKLADLLVASIAHQHGFGVLHYDRDYDTIARHAGLTFESAWIAPAGSVD